MENNSQNHNKESKLSSSEGQFDRKLSLTELQFLLDSNQVDEITFYKNGDDYCLCLLRPLNDNDDKESASFISRIIFKRTREDLGKLIHEARMSLEKDDYE